MVSAPQAPDPFQTAQAQSQWNNTTAQTQQAMNMVDQHSAWGSSTFQQTGTQEILGPDGRPISVPKYQQTTTLSPEQQAIFDQTQTAQGNIAGLASDQSEFMRDYLSKPFEFQNSDAEQWAYDLASPRILGQQGQNEAALRTTLANKGIREGSAAWNAEMGRMTNANTDQLNQLALTGRGQAFGEALTERNQPIQELSALMSGSQVAMPQFGATPQASVGGVDYTGLVNNKFQAETASHNAMMGGLFGLASAPFSMFSFKSDRRAKEDIAAVGKLGNGLTVYRYRMKGDPRFQIGLMADEVEVLVPAAVGTGSDGMKMVDYRAATESA